MRNIISLCIKIFLLLTFLNCAMAKADETILRAAALAVDLDLPDGVPLAGFGGAKRRNFNPFKRSRYSHYFKPNEGVADPIRAKILLLEKSDLKLLWIGVDLVAADPKLRAAVSDGVQDLGIKKENILLSASHTHSGPGAFADNRFWAFVALDCYKDEIFSHMVDAIVDAVYEAHAQLTPALLGTGDLRIENVTNNRRGSAFLDPVATIVRVDSTVGKPIATVFNFPIHGTVQGMSNLRLSADVSGAIERRIENLTGSVGFFLNGAEGDVAPQAGSEPEAWDRAQAMGSKIGEAIAAKRMVLPVYPVQKMRHVVKEIDLPTAKINIGTCLKKGGTGRTKIRLSRWLPKVAPFHAVALDDTAFVTIAGEPIAEMGLQLKQFGLAQGFAHVGVVGLTNDHLGYILTQDEYLKGGAESCASFYGEHLGLMVQTAAEEVLKELK